MALFASINDFPLQGGVLTFPFYGAWIADVNVASGGHDLSGRVTLVLAGITLQGYVFRGGDFTGSTKYRICGGAGWQTVIPEKPYRNPFGVKLSVILGDAAREVGETVEIQTGLDVSSPFYVRQKAPASQVLRQLAPHWWIRNDGVTQIGTRTSPVISSKFEVLQGTDLGLGRIVIGTGTPESWVPGSIFSNVTLPQRYRVSAVAHRWSANKLQTVVWTTP